MLYSLIVTIDYWTSDFQIRTNPLRKAYSYDEERIDGVNLPPLLENR